MNHAWTAKLPKFIRNKFENRHDLQNIIINTGWLFSDKLLRMGIGLFVGVWIARYLGPEQFGVLNFAIAFVALFGALASLGVDGIVVREIVRYPEHKFEILSSAFALKLCGGVIAFTITVAAILTLRPSDNQAHWLVGIIAAGMIFQSFDAIELWFQSQVQSKYTVIAKCCAFLTLTLVRVVLILQRASLKAFAYAILAEIILGAIALTMIYLRKEVSIFWCPRKDTCIKLLSESWPAILSGIAIMIYMRIDQIMLLQISGNREVGLYSAALSFSEIWYFMPAVIASSFVPMLTQSRQESKEVYLLQIQQLLNYLVRIAYFIAVPVTFTSSYIFNTFYGQAYNGASTILAIHIWAAVFVFLGIGMSPWFLNEGLLKFTLLQTVAGAVINVILNFILIPKYAGVGAAIATVISYGLSVFLSNALFARTRVIFIFQCKALCQLK